VVAKPVALATLLGACAAEVGGDGGGARDSEVEPGDDTGVARVPEHLDDFALAVHDVLLMSAFVTTVGRANAFGLTEDDPACPARSRDDAGREHVVGGCTTTSGVAYDGEVVTSGRAWEASGWSYEGSFLGRGRVDGHGDADDAGRLRGTLSMEGTVFGWLGAAPIDDASFDLTVTNVRQRGALDGFFGVLGHRVALELDVASSGPTLGRGFAFATGSLRYAWPGHVLHVQLDEVDAASGCPLATLDDGPPEVLCLR
jgi:hypothetical protein